MLRQDLIYPHDLYVQYGEHKIQDLEEYQSYRRVLHPKYQVHERQRPSQQGYRFYFL